MSRIKTEDLIELYETNEIDPRKAHDDFFAKYGRHANIVDIEDGRCLSHLIRLTKEKTGGIES